MKLLVVMNDYDQNEFIALKKSRAGLDREVEGPEWKEGERRVAGIQRAWRTEDSWEVVAVMRGRVNLVT